MDILPFDFEIEVDFEVEVENKTIARQLFSN